MLQFFVHYDEVEVHSYYTGFRAKSYQDAMAKLADFAGKGQVVRKLTIVDKNNDSRVLYENNKE